MLLVLLPSFSFGYLEDKLSCALNNKDITVSLNKTAGSSCKAYIAYIEQTMRQTARDLFTIQEYVTQGHDTDYRQQVKKDKLALIDKFQGVRLNIIASMKTFEDNLLKKSLDYFILKVTPYKIQLTRSLFKLSVLTGGIPPDVKKYQTLLSGEVETIDKIGKAKSFEELIPLLSGYIYFKQEIS